MPHIITISTEQKTFQAYDVAEWGTLRATSLKSCAARKLARMMIATGVEDGPIEARGTGGQLRYTVRSLFAFAKYTLSENPGLHRVKWAPHPHARVLEDAA